MGLTFTQRFYQVPEVYIIRFSIIGDLEDAQAIAGIIAVPEDKTLDSMIHDEFESEGYWLERFDLHKKAVDGREILEEVGIEPNYMYEW